MFDNRFPALGGQGHAERSDAPRRDGAGRRPLRGRRLHARPRRLRSARSPLDHLELLLSVWADRTRRLGARDDVRYVFPFENRGVEVGATLHHPHGQIYAYPVVPPVPARMAEQAREHLAAHGRGLLETMIDAERRDGVRMLYAGAHAVAFVPVCARYPYECWVAPIRPAAQFGDLDDAAARRPRARAEDGAAEVRRPVAPADALPDGLVPGARATAARIPRRTCTRSSFRPIARAERLKYLAGTELGAGFYAMDALPEDKARELQAIEVTLS